ncbi:type VI secretion system contractile sheath large subunit [Azospirillum sp. ST 5-10]|uniref:type VI secretion system contractile sheath large subunit n=1 Tax=unclassified Azospirillum TaxID=2630922 RepID=UPI003F49FA3E
MSDTEALQAGNAATAVEETSLLDDILAETKLAPKDDAYGVAKRGIEAFLGELLKSPNKGEKVHKDLVDVMIAELDKKIGDQLDQILHDEQVQKLESAWRGLKLVVDRTDFRQNIKVELLNVSKESLLEDFEDAPEVVKSGLYRHVYTDEFGQFGGQPFAAMIGNYDFGPGAQDVKLLQYVASVGAMSHAPFIGATAPEMFGCKSYEELPQLKDLSSIFDGPQYAKWKSFRESDDSRYVGLTAPRFLLRLPYGEKSNPVKSFNYNETVVGKHQSYLWGNTAFAFASKLTDSFAKYRWCPNVIGPQSGGAVEDLPLYQYESMGQIETKCPTEVMVSDRREYEMAEQGFIALTMRKGSDNAAFFSANSVQKPKFFGNSAEGKEAELNYKLGTQLPYMFIINRLAHYIKVLQRENIGSWKSAPELQTELNNWIKQYVSDQENPSADVRSRRPLRQALIEVSDVEGEPGWYRVNMAVRPHFKYMGADFTLTLKGKLDKA